MTGFSSSTLSALALDGQGNITVPAGSDVSLGSGLMLNSVAIDRAGENLYVAEENSGIYPVALSFSGRSVTMTAGNVVASGSGGCLYVVTDPAPGSANIFTSDGASASAFDCSSAGLKLDNSLQAGGSSGWLAYGPPGGLSVDPQARYLYIASDTDEGTWQIPLSGVTIGTPGNLAGSQSSNMGPDCCLVDPSNQNLVVGNDDGTIEVFSLSGGLAENSNQGPIQGGSTGGSIMAIAFDPTGSYFATANGPSNDVCLFSYDGNSGSANIASTAIGLNNTTGVIFNPDASTPVVYFANTGASPASIAAFKYGRNTLDLLNNGRPFPTSANVAGPTGMAIK